MNRNPASAGFFVPATFPEPPQIPLWERACSRRGRISRHPCWLTHRLRGQARSHRDLWCS
ncbi:hypothetical protein E4T63_03435 [Pseudomonas fluorescens]|uniref:Uncharacterized protein n=1 Tax=Pseudomonas fluorescens TaxID=294 RepID=A0AAP8YY51_PSEFL|nr:hypothetical protein E4T63_03435 [Pseudomonas fluorescens]